MEANFYKKKSQGFTLIEVILSITILSSLAVMVTTVLSRALKARVKIQAEVRDVSSLRDSIKVMRADIYQAYHHFDFEKEIYDIAKKPTPAGSPGQPLGTPIPGAGRQAQPPPGAPQAPEPQRENKRENPQTDFIGDEDELNFVTLNNGRFMANDIQADFIEVGYLLKSCKNLSKQTTSQCLYRRIQKVIDRDVEKGGTESVLLENVKEFKLRYIGEGKRDWVNEWKTRGGIDDSTKNIFPDAVEINLSIERDFGTKKREYSLQYVVPLHFPNNVKSNDKKPNRL